MLYVAVSGAMTGHLMAERALRFFSEQEYLQIEKQSTQRSEYANGQIYAMAGASRKHNKITVNIASSLHHQLKSKPCFVAASDMRVKVEASKFYTYPDIVVVCDENADSEQETVTNPAFIAEVLSKTTESYDRGEKLSEYMRIVSLKEILLVAQDSEIFELYRRSDNEWQMVEKGNGPVQLQSIGCTLDAADVWFRV